VNTSVGSDSERTDPGLWGASGSVDESRVGSRGEVPRSVSAAQYEEETDWSRFAQGSSTLGRLTPAEEGALWVLEDLNSTSNSNCNSNCNSNSNNKNKNRNRDSNNDRGSRGSRKSLNLSLTSKSPSSSTLNSTLNNTLNSTLNSP